VFPKSDFFHRFVVQEFHVSIQLLCHLLFFAIFRRKKILTNFDIFVFLKKTKASCFTEHDYPAKKIITALERSISTFFKTSRLEKDIYVFRHVKTFLVINGTDVTILKIFSQKTPFFAENWQKSQKIVIVTSTPGCNISWKRNITLYVTRYKGISSICRIRVPTC
jgi:hypothetical protein